MLIYKKHVSEIGLKMFHICKMEMQENDTEILLKM